jgi:hypothetical protein
MALKKFKPKPAHAGSVRPRIRSIRTRQAESRRRRDTA